MQFFTLKNFHFRFFPKFLHFRVTQIRLFHRPLEMTSMYNQFRVRKTVLEMLEDRGYFTNAYQMRDFDQFCESFPGCIKDSSCLRIVVQKNAQSNDTSSLLVHFAEEDKMSLKSAKLLLENTFNQGIKNLVLVLREGISPAAKKLATECDSITITIFTERDLLFNITKHKLVPNHRIISQTEKEKLLVEKMIKETDMPKILIDDPVAKYYGAKKGDVIEIERDSETAGKILTWRITI